MLYILILQQYLGSYWNTNVPAFCVKMFPLCKFRTYYCTNSVDYTQTVSQFSDDGMRYININSLYSNSLQKLYVCKRMEEKPTEGATSCAQVNLISISILLTF